MQQTHALNMWQMSLVQSSVECSEYLVVSKSWSSCMLVGQIPSFSNTHRGIADFLGIITHPCWPTTSLLLNLHPGNDIALEQIDGVVGKIQKSVQIKDGTTLIQCHLCLRGTSHANHCKLPWPMITVEAVLVPRYGHFFLLTCYTEERPQFAAVTKGKHQVKETKGQQDATLHQTKSTADHSHQLFLYMPLHQTILNDEKPTGYPLVSLTQGQMDVKSL